ncbi:hypothetical protein Trco_000091 [Trichoderma cornu-damae]|uniref:Extracellular membrane protein CFEM domain-containing protein n=1 Tax=Trichoderma cornu-damae TaxID=654480 RepID=A0A9P8TW02_9HYPO|nr:hypothetical protein Trco_000091 [Trichoderma cornu-damae]
MKFSCAAALALGGGALAMSQAECFTQHSQELVEFSDCGHRASLEYCLSQLSSPAAGDIEACYSNAGCSMAEAASEAKYALQRCDELSKMGDLKKRYRGVLENAARTVAARNPHAAPAPTHWVRDGSLECLATSTVQTSSCDIKTDKGVLRTITCVPTEVAKSACAPGLMCSIDSVGHTVCMKKQDQLDVGGIIIAIIFGVAIVVAITFLTFACCRERRHQKQLEARAEATALARAQTKKARAAEARAPLMRQEGGDPFADRNQS